MTVREVYEAVLVEINKVNAATFTTEEFNYVLNKAILGFTNERYNFYAVNQQLSDDLRVLQKKATFNYNVDIDGAPRTDATYNAISGKVYSKGTLINTEVYVSSLTDLVVGSLIKFSPTGSEFEVISVDDTMYPYLINVDGDASAVPIGSPILLKTLNVGVTPDYDDVEIADGHITFTLPSSDYLHILSCRTNWKGRKPNGQTAYLIYGAKRMTYDIQNVIQNNTYMRPAYNRPYFMVQDNTLNAGIDKITSVADYRAYHNKPQVDVYIGKPVNTAVVDTIVIDYIKNPETIILSDIDIFTAGADTSQVLEFPDYLKNEIVKRVSLYMLENMRDPRTGSHPQVNNEIPGVPYEVQQAAGQRRQQQQPEQQQ